MMQSRSIISVRKRSDKMICGIPLYDIAFGPDPQKGEFRGRAHGVIAIGDIAVGWLAVGGAAMGYYAYGDAAWGQHVISSVERSPEAVAFFKFWLPRLK